MWKTFQILAILYLCFAEVHCTEPVVTPETYVEDETRYLKFTCTDYLLPWEILAWYQTKDLETEDRQEYLSKLIWKVTNNTVRFRVRAAKDAYVGFFSTPNKAHPMWEVIIGGKANKQCVIKKNEKNEEVVATPSILSKSEFRGFWIQWDDDGRIAVGREGETGAFLKWEDKNPFPVNYFGIFTAHGAEGIWRIEGLTYMTEDKLLNMTRLKDLDLAGPVQLNLNKPLEQSDNGSRVYCSKYSKRQDSKKKISINFLKDIPAFGKSSVPDLPCAVLQLLVAVVVYWL